MRPLASRSIPRLPALLLGPIALVTCFGACHSGRPVRAAVPAAGMLRHASACFIRNQGQAPAPISYYVRGQDRTVYFTPDGMTLSLAVPRQETAAEATPLRRRVPHSAPSRYAVKLDFVRAEASASLVGEDPQKGVANFLSGSSRAWTRRVPTYAGLRYEALWKGADLAYRGTETGLKYEFRLQPGADPASIRLAYRGVDSVRVDAAGQLQVTTPAGSFTDEAPVAYQERNGQREPVSACYEVTRRPDGAWEYGFDVGRYDHNRPLIIDPALLIYCGYLGGSAQDLAAGIAVDAQGSAYVAGYTYSSEATFPVQPGFDSTANGSVDAFIAKIRADGTGFDYCTYLGGMGDDTATCIAVDPTGRACVGGITTSTESTFPVLTGPDLTYSGNGDGWVARLKADGSGLDYCGYLGGIAADEVSGVATDAAGRVLVGGSTTSDEASFPVGTGPDLTYNGSADAFAARLSPTGASLDFCGYLGGTGEDFAYGVALAPNGDLGIAGVTASTDATFPVVVGPDLTRNDNPEMFTDAFVARVRADGTGLTYCGFVGGASHETLFGICFDGDGNAYAAGSTLSDETSLPVLVGPGLLHSESNSDAFVVKVNPSGSALLYCGYIGGIGSDDAYAIAVDGAGNAYVGGATQAPPTSFPVKAGPDLQFRGGFQDGFVARVRANGTGLDYCGYVGGAGTDIISGIAVDTDRNAYVAGVTGSRPDSFPARIGPLATFNGGSADVQSDAFVAKIAALTGPVGEAGRLVVAPKRLQAGVVRIGKTKKLKLKLRNTGPGTIHLNVPPLAAPFSSTPTGNLLLPARQSQVVTITFAPSSAGVVVGGLTITSDDPRAPLTVIPLSGKGK